MSVTHRPCHNCHNSRQLKTQLSLCIFSFHCSRRPCVGQWGKTCEIVRWRLVVSYISASTVMGNQQSLRYEPRRDLEPAKPALSRSRSVRSNANRMENDEGETRYLPKGLRRPDSNGPIVPTMPFGGASAPTSGIESPQWGCKNNLVSTDVDIPNNGNSHEILFSATRVYQHHTPNTRDVLQQQTTQAQCIIVFCRFVQFKCRHLIFRRFGYSCPYVTTSIESCL